MHDWTPEKFLLCLRSGRKKNAIRELDSGDDMQIRRRLKCDEDLQRLVMFLKFDHFYNVYRIVYTIVCDHKRTRKSKN